MEERLAQSLHNAVWLTLGMERQDYRVQRPWSATIAQQSQTPTPLEAGTRIVEVFDRPELARQLLILGEPGAGKTTMMLELAQDLVQRSIADKSQPIPVLISLSSWKPNSEKKAQPMFEWLVDELKGKYGIRQDLARQWLEENQLLPLLDGLDEVAPQHQKECAVALNAWMTEDLIRKPCGVLICCRREEFEQVVQQPLSLYGAIYLQALTIEQIAEYFTQFELQDVWQTVQQDEALQELLTKPLFLSMFGLVQTQKKFSIDDWRSRTTSDRKIEYLLDTYWDAAIERELIIDPIAKQLGTLSKTYGTKLLPQREVVQRALVFVARALEQESQTEILIERMQPSWLPEKQQEASYRLLFALLLFVCIQASMQIGSLFSKEFILLLFTFPWLGYFLTMDRIKPAEGFEFREMGFLFTEYLPFIRLGFSVAATLVAGLAWLLGKTEAGWSYAVVVITGLTINRSIIWLFAKTRSEITTQIEANQGIKNSWRNIPFFVFCALLLICLLSLRFQLGIRIFVNEEFSLQIFFAYFIYIVSFAAFEGGGKALLQHCTLRLVLAWNQYAPFRYDLLLNYCTERLLLQRIGGRYRFMHKLLQDHFAKMEF